MVQMYGVAGKRIPRTPACMCILGPFVGALAIVPKIGPRSAAYPCQTGDCFVNGTLLKQVLSAGELTDSTFFVDDASGQIRIYPPSGTDMTTATVEVGVRPHLFNIHGVSNFTVDGLEFTKAATCLPGGSMELFDSSNDTLANSQFNWNNWEGLVLHNVTNITIRSVQASHNGGSGLAGYRLKNMNLQDSETSFNNWRGTGVSSTFFTGRHKVSACTRQSSPEFSSHQ